MPVTKESRMSEQSSVPQRSDKSYAERNRQRFDKIKSEPMVAVFGNPMYAKYFGNVYSFDFQDYPVTIQFDGKTYFYHKTIAEMLQNKLNAAAMSHAQSIAGEGDKLY